jgi:DNA polymerase-3 subunit gamma/tau
MSNYIVSARKYRPASFATVVGQQTLTHTLKTAIASGRLAHAYLFCGPRGVGKTTCARIFAKTINCEHPTPDGEACNECASCRAFNEQSSFNIIEMDAASNNGVDAIRDLTEQVRIPPQAGRYKVYIIDEVHMLSAAAFNAFLKTLEEPPEYAIFVLATTEKQKVIPTILSRCQIYDFARITVPDIVLQLQHICQEEGVTAEPAALNVIAQKADGAMRDALSIFDQVTASSQGNITYQSALENLNVLDYEYYFRLVEAFLAGDVPQALLIYKEVRDKGFDSQFFVNGLAQHLRDLMVASTPQTIGLLEMNEEVGQRYVLQAAKLGPRFYYRALDLCNTCDLNYRNATNKQLLVELTLIKLCQMVSPIDSQQGGKGSGSEIKPIAAHPAPQPTTPQQATTATPAKTEARQDMIATSQPVPKPAPQPAESQPAYKPVANQPTRTAKSSQPRILVNAQPQSTTGVAESTNTVTIRREPFSAEQLQKAWQGYIGQNPHEKVIISSMRTARLRQVNDTLYEVTVEGQAQVESIESNKTKIMTYLRDAVHNDMLAIDIKVSQSKEDHRILTPREVVEDIKQRRPDFVPFIESFQLGLA